MLSGNLGSMGSSVRSWESLPDSSERSKATFDLVSTNRLTWPMWGTAIEAMYDALQYERSFGFSIQHTSAGELEIGSGLMEITQDEIRTTSDMTPDSNSR